VTKEDPVQKYGDQIRTATLDLVDVPPRCSHSPKAVARTDHEQPTPHQRAAPKPG
jgi:hypothetical protein